MAPESNGRGGLTDRLVFEQFQNERHGSPVVARRLLFCLRYIKGGSELG